MSTHPERENLPASRAEARKLSRKYYYTGKPCKNGHLAERITRNSLCIECKREYTNQWRLNNPEHVRRTRREYHWANVEHARKQSRDWYWKNREYNIRQSLAWYQNNKERALEARRKWRKENLEYARELGRQLQPEQIDLRRERNAARRAAKLKRTPPWANRDTIRDIYIIARRLTDETGVEHHVDHIIPLRGENVSGLHVAENLRAVPATVNLIKGRRYDNARVTSIEEVL